jgi:cysteine desulfurase family protein (TIGR01976 family)
MPAFDVDALRAEFPALAREQEGRPVCFLDGPGGTQVPRRVIDAVVGYYRDTNANADGAFITSRLSDAIVDEAHAAVADFLGAAGPDEIKFGYNMSTLTLHIGRSIGATLGPGDEIIVTTLDHEANVSTWRAMAADRGVTVHTVDIHDEDVTLDLEDLESKLSSRTKLVAVGYASNAVGTVNPVGEIVARAHEVGALTYIDAVAYAPHGPIDVQALDTDFLVCSVYKWFGPHLGALYGKADVLERLPAYKVRPAHDRFETGTASFESIAGTLAATDYLRDVGRSFGDVSGAPGAGAASERRRELVAGMIAIRDYERGLVTGLVDGLERLPGVTIHGITDRSHFGSRVPTVSVSIEGIHPRAAAEALGRQGIFTWDGDFYATGLIERLGKAETGGVLRLGLVHYNTAAEVERTLDALAGLR